MNNEQELTNLKNSYLVAIDEEIARLTKLSELIENQSNVFTKFFDSIRSEKERTDAQIKQLEQHKREIEAGTYNYGFSPVTERLEEKIVEKEEMINTLEDQINNLEERKANEDLSDSDISIIDAQISYKQKTLEKLKNKTTKLGNRQKSIALRKVRLRGLKDRMIAKQEVRVAKNENKVETLEAKQEALGDGAIDSLKDSVLEVRKSINEWKAGFNRAVLEKLKNSKMTGIAGARAIAISKVSIDRLRGRINNNTNQNDLNNMFPPQPAEAAPTNTL